MDAAPPNREPPALIAPAARAAPPNRAMSPSFSLRTGFGGGFGASGFGGIAGSYFLQADGWAGREGGLGLEGEIAGATDLSGKDSTTLAAVRARTSVRLATAENSLFAISFALGFASVTVEPRVVTVTPCQDGAYGCVSGPSGFRRVSDSGGSGVSPAVGVELAYRHHYSAFELGFYTRVSLTAANVLVTGGPTFGFGL